MISSATSALGIFDHRQHAMDAIAALKRSGFSGKQIGIASREFAEPFAKVDVEAQHVAEEGAKKGAAIGGGVGAAIGLIGGLMVPGIVPIVLGSTLVAALLGGATGAAGGALAGPFMALGFSESEANRHGEHIAVGKTLVVVYDPDRRVEATQIMVQHGAYDASMSTGP